MMKSLIATFFLLLSFAQAHASEDLLFRWNRSEVKKVEGTNASMQILERFMLVGPKSYGIGTLTLTKALRDPENFTTIINDIKNESGFTFKRTFTYEGITFAEFKWEKGNRLIRYGLSDAGDYRLISISSYRPGYASISGPESASLQVKWHKHEERGGRSTSMILFNTIFPEAHAQGIPGFDMSPILNSIGSTSGSSITTPNLTGGVTTFDQNLNVNVTGAVDVGGDVNINGLNEPVAELGNIADRSISSVDSMATDRLNQVDQIATDRLNQADGMINDALGDADRIASENMDRVEQLADDGLAQADRTTKMVDKNWSETNKQFAEANKIAAKMSDPKHAFLLAGATAAGAVIGSTVASLAVQGVVKGLDWLIEQITDAKGKEERWRLFREAREKWEETMGNARDLEASIDQFLLFNDVLKTIKGRLPASEQKNLNIENVIAQFGREILLKQKRRDELYKKFMAAQTPACEAQLAMEVQNMDALIANLGQVMGHLQEHKKNNPGVDVFDDRFFCDQLGEMLRNLVDAESALQRYRMFMIAGQTEWRDQAMNDFEDLQGRTDDFNKRQDGDFESRELDTIKKRHKANYAAMERQFKQICNNQKALSYRKCYDQKWNSPEASAQRKRWDEAKYNELQALAQRTKYRAQNPLGLNSDVENQRLERYRKWFQELEDQQFCAQNPTDERCLELDQFRFNGNFYVKDKAFAKMNDVCPGRELSLPSITERKVEEARVAAEQEALKSGRAPASEKKSGGFFSAIGDFFKGIFDSISNFFGFGGKKAVIGEDQARDVAVPDPEYAHAVVDDSRTQLTSPSADIPAETADREPAQVAPSYAKQIENGKKASELVSELGLAALSPELGDKLEKDVTSRIEALGSENIDAEKLNSIIDQAEKLKARPSHERERILSALYTEPSALPAPLASIYKAAWERGDDPQHMLSYLTLATPMVGIGFKWPAGDKALMDELNGIPGINVSNYGMMIDMGLLPEKYYNDGLFEILMEFKRLKAGDEAATSSALQKLKAYLAN